MLRSKNLTKVLEQALTEDICLCAVFTEHGVVLAHAATTNDFSISSLQASNNRTSQMPDLGAEYPDASRHPEPPYENTEFHHSEQEFGHRGAAVGAASAAHGHENGIDTYPSFQTQPTAATAATATARYSQRHAGFDNTGDEPLASTFKDDPFDLSPNLSAREELEDDLAIAADLWQSYENMSSLVERKDHVAYDSTGSPAYESRSNQVSNNLHMIIIDCEYGKIAVAPVNRYRLFILSNPSTPFGLLKLKSDSLCRFLGERLRGQ